MLRKFVKLYPVLEWLRISSAERDLLENADLSSFAEEWSHLKNRRVKFVFFYANSNALRTEFVFIGLFLKKMLEQTFI